MTLAVKVTPRWTTTLSAVSVEHIVELPSSDVSNPTRIEPLCTGWFVTRVARVVREKVS
jgi:hypothetical protein